ncbi:MAG: DUF3179 domain-containing protein [Chloroflexi bacterium]|nr:DUF3179 domain-containing protein [Chloroflexota bacterium]
MVSVRNRLVPILGLVALTGTACGPAGLAGGPLLAELDSQTEANPCDRSQARVSLSGWRTDFDRCLVPLREFRGGGPPRDGIPPLDSPRFEGVAQADRWLRPPEPVIFLELHGDARAYPLQVLIWHEIVNDEVGGQPLAVTFCPLCNTAIAFDRRVGERTLDFGTTGNLRLSDLVMWDRQTESWWQQASGEALVGELAGARLRMVPASVVAWADFKRQRPNGRVLSRETGFQRDYGRNPYVGYDDAGSAPFLYDGPIDGRLRPMERVVTVSLAGETVVYPATRLLDRRAINDTVGGQPVIVLLQPGTASALDRGQIADSRDVGASAVYLRQVDGRVLSFAWDGGAFVDAETSSRWTLLGEAEAGPLAGTRLTPAVHTDAFWFASAAFFPNVRIWAP